MDVLYMDIVYILYMDTNHMIDVTPHPVCVCVRAGRV